MTRIHLRVAQEAKLHRLPVTQPNTCGMDHRQVHHGIVHGILILDAVDVKTIYNQSALRYQCLQ